MSFSACYTINKKQNFMQTMRMKQVVICMKKHSSLQAENTEYGIKL